MDITEVSIIHHIALVLLLLWILVAVGWGHPVAFFAALLYLFAVNERYSLRLRRRLQFEERKYANQKRLLCDSETVRWLNHAVEKVWPICMEKIASQQFLLPIIPWFLEKYKPWTAKKAVVQHLYLGRNPPMFTEIRVLGESVDDDHLVLELGMNFLSADDMSAILAVQLRKRLGFGLWANMHVTGMHLEGKVRVGVKFLRHWPFLGRMRVCFVEPPYFQMTVKPIFNHGVDVTELPGIAGWLDNILAAAFEQSLVEPNMLVVDVEKFASAPKEAWFTVDEKPPVAYAKVEIVEAADMKPSDLNGLADPYVKGHLGPYRFRTKTQKKTLAPKWLEEFKIPISSWEAPNVLVLEVRDKDHIFDDMLGDCAINISELGRGQRHDKWMPLRNIKMGRLHLAITVLEDEDDKGKEHQSVDDGDNELSKDAESVTPRSNSLAPNHNTDDVPTEEGRKMADEFEPINIEGQEKTGIWVHHPGTDVSQTWEPRKGRARRPETQLHREENEWVNSPGSTDSGSQCSDNNENTDGKKVPHLKTIRRVLRKIGSIFHKSSENDSPGREEVVVPTPRPNIRAVGETGTSVRVIFDESCDASSGDRKVVKESSSPEKDEVESPGKGNVKGIAKNIIKQAGKSAQSLRSVLSRKGSAKLKDDDLPETEKREESQESDESIDALKDDPLAVRGVPIDVASPSDHEKPSINDEERVAQLSSDPRTDPGESLSIVENVRPGSPGVQGTYLDRETAEEGNSKVESSAG